MSDDYNPIFENIFARIEEGGDEIIAYIAYGLYKEQKRDFLIQEKERLKGPVPQEQLDAFHRFINERQIELLWNAAAESLGRFALNFADEEKKEAVREALADAVKGKFWQQVWVTASATFIFAIGSIVIYFGLRFIGFDLIDQLNKLEKMFLTT